MDDNITTSVGNLFKKLHSGLTALYRESSKLKSLNDSVNADEIRKARGEIIERLAEGNELQESRTLLKILDLFSKDGAFVGLVKDESGEWIDFLTLIEHNLDIMIGDLEGEDKKIAEQTLASIEKAKEMLRK